MHLGALAKLHEEVRNREVKEKALKKGVAGVKHWEVFLDNLKATQMTACMSTNGLFLLLTSMLAFAKQHSKSMDRFDHTVRITGRRTKILLFSGLNSLSHHSRNKIEAELSDKVRNKRKTTTCRS